LTFDGKKLPNTQIKKPPVWSPLVNHKIPRKSPSIKAMHSKDYNDKILQKKNMKIPKSWQNNKYK
jgi:hypothetical protein